MDSKRITLIISDLHVGGGAADAGDDHVYHKNQLRQFINAQTESPEGQAGKLELFINGDFLEFAQTNTGAFAHDSDDAWCSESESLEKLNTIIAGHPDIFDALKSFQAKKNVLTIAAGNHDVDLYWPKVRSRLQEVAGGATNFEIGKQWVERYDGKLQIAHGHMDDVANMFANWSKPLSATKSRVPRLEMCPGTLFMVKFVNKLEAKYPFADNLLPVTKLASLLWSDDKSGLASVSWMFAKFVATSPLSVLHEGPSNSYGQRLVGRFKDPADAAKLSTVLTAQGRDADAALASSLKLNEQSLSRIMMDLLGRIELEAWQALFELPRNPTTLGDQPLTLSAIQSANGVDGKLLLRKIAKEQLKLTDASVVVLGHTHQPDEVTWGESQKYYNPGSWTRYLELTNGMHVTLDDLRDESKFPYRLNVVRIEPRSTGLSSTMMLIDSEPSRF